MTLADVLMALTLSNDTWPQEKFEGHGGIGIILAIALVAITWAILTDKEK